MATHGSGHNLCYAKLGQREEDEGEGGRIVASEEIHVGGSGIELLQVA